jgi:hypothetical protein
MKLLLAISISAVLLAAADQAPKPPLAVPSGAVATAPGSYRYTDAEGRKWIYHTSPFGVTREAEGGPQRFTRDFSNVKATEQGDSIRFERPTPFGAFHWQTRKSELNDMERMVWEREQASRSAAAAQE